MEERGAWVWLHLDYLGVMVLVQGEKNQEILHFPPSPSCLLPPLLPRDNKGRGKNHQREFSQLIYTIFYFSTVEVSDHISIYM